MYRGRGGVRGMGWERRGGVRGMGWDAVGKRRSERDGVGWERNEK